MHNYIRIDFLLCFLSILFGSCQVGPSYTPPCMETPAEWHTNLSDGMQNEPLQDFIWWESLHDPLLNLLIERASEQNVDLYIAATRVLEARAAEKGGAAELYPHLDASLNGGHVQYNQKVLDRVLGIHHGSHDKHKNLNFFEAGFDAEWELDLFGVQAHEMKALKAQIDSSKEAYMHLWITLSAEVAKNYIEVRGLQTRLSHLEREIDTQNETVNITKGLIQAGFVGSLDETQAESELLSLQSEKPLIVLSINKAIHRLSILLGYSPGELFCLLNERGVLPNLPDQKPLGIPSELLRRRPDIKKAERDLAAASERVGSAIASLFPRLSLTGFIADIGACRASGFNGFGGSELLFPIFNSKLLQQDVDLNKIRTQQALYVYQKTILEALEEVENAIASFRYESERNAYLNRALQSSQKAYQSISDLYKRGLKSYLDVLVASRNLNTAEQAYLLSQMDLLFHYIALYKALGGGWNLEDSTTPCE